MEQSEAVKDAIQPDIGVGKEIILLICEHNVSQSSCSACKHGAQMVAGEFPLEIANNSRISTTIQQIEGRRQFSS